MRKLRYFIRNYIKELITTLIGFLSAVIVYKTNDNESLTLRLSIIISFISAIIIIYLRSRDRDFYFVSFSKRSEGDDWIGRGVFEFVRSEKCFRITNSEEGFILAKSLLWQNYQFAADFKIINSCVGFILRAINLSNCIMLQIGVNGIRPHIRVNGGWKAWEINESGLGFNQNLSLDEWYRSVVVCEKDAITIKIFSPKGMIFDRQWNIPSGKAGFSFASQDSIPDQMIIFPLIVEYGSVGFRNADDEEALVKNLLVEKL